MIVFDVAMAVVFLFCLNKKHDDRQPIEKKKTKRNADGLRFCFSSHKIDD